VLVPLARYKKQMELLRAKESRDDKWKIPPKLKAKIERQLEYLNNCKRYREPTLEKIMLVLAGSKGQLPISRHKFLNILGENWFSSFDIRQFYYK